MDQFLPGSPASMFPRRSNFVKIGDYYRNYRFVAPTNHIRRTVPLVPEFLERGFMSDMIYGHHHGLQHYGQHHFGLERSDFLYVLPILLVIGLGAFLIPIITTFFITLISSQGSYCGRRKRSVPRKEENEFILNEKVGDLWRAFEQAFSSEMIK